MRILVLKLILLSTIALLVRTSASRKARAFTKRNCHLSKNKSTKKFSSTAFLNYDCPLRMRGGEIHESKQGSAVDKKIDATIASKDVNLMFSDVDGTLVHYPDEIIKSEPGNKIIYLPASSTGMRGIISSKTLMLCQKLRRERDVKFVLVSGMRTSTLIKRLPYLPKADAYASEAGGRIFYPIPKMIGTDCESSNIVTPVPFDGARNEDLDSFGLVEDEYWRSIMSENCAAGTDGYIGNAMDIFLGKEEETEILEIDQRHGALWEFGKRLEAGGFVLDYKGYSNCFRVNIKQQSTKTQEEFDDLKNINVSSLGLASSVNLGCIDFYPIKSGKKNCCAYLSRRFANYQDTDIEEASLEDDELVLNQCICLCDDDNDLEMANSCGRVFLPSISSASMQEAANSSSEKIVLAENKNEGIVGIKATENALLLAKREFEKRILRP